MNLLTSFNLFSVMLNYGQIYSVFNIGLF